MKTRISDRLKKDFKTAVKKYGYVNQIIVEVEDESVKIFFAKDGEKLVAIDGIVVKLGDTVTLDLPKNIPFSID